MRLKTFPQCNRKHIKLPFCCYMYDLLGYFEKHSGNQAQAEMDPTHLYLLLKVFDFLPSLHLFSLLLIQVLSRDLKLILKSLQLFLQRLHLPLGVVEGLGLNLRGEGTRRRRDKEEKGRGGEE